MAFAATSAPAASCKSIEYFDVLIVGAGLSGIGAGCHLRKRCPDKTFALLEMREASGGTWDLFRYPGVRSDSDMYSLGYSFRPWREDASIAGGDAILRYIRETAREHGIEAHVRYSQRVLRADWSSADALWTVEVQGADGPRRYSCRFLHLCTGYYDYAGGHAPEFPGMGDFRGTLVHPQQWPRDLDYAGRDVVVIGSGATAVTLVPEMAKRARHVTLLQRSPTYVVCMPSRDRVANGLRAVLPARLAYALTRWKNVALNTAFYQLARWRPRFVRKLLLRALAKKMGSGIDMRHFTPAYAPWDQRLCLVPDADLPAALRSGAASVVTDTIERFTARGIRLASGRELPADIVVSATGLRLQMIGGARLSVDGKVVNIPERTVYKGMMIDEVPNAAFAVGYTNAAWTLKCDLVAQYVCRLLDHMDRTGMRQCTPRLSSPVRTEPLIDFTSGYVQRAAGMLPRQGHRAPWKLRQNYAWDWLALRHGSVTREMEFSNPAPRVSGSPGAGC